METKNIKTSHDMAVALEGFAKILRAYPEFRLPEFEQSLDESNAQTSGRKTADKNRIQFRLEDLANRFPNLEKSTAQAEIETLTVDSIRQLSVLLGIRMPSKLKKSQAIEMLLEQVFDIPAGQELLRTFHRRKHSS
jgi:type II secretory pathway component PulK